jgi:DNA-binding NtrC family response regulator
MKEAGLSEMAMTTDPVMKAAQSYAPDEVVSLLIGSTVEEVERVLVVQTLARCDGNRTRAARMLGLSVRTLRNKVRLYSAEGIEVPMHLKEERFKPAKTPSKRNYIG